MGSDLLPDVDERFRTWFLDPAAQQRAVVRNMRRLTAELRSGPGDPGDRQDRTASVIYLLGADTTADVPDDVFAEFATVVVRAVADQGAGTGYHRHDLAVRAIDAAIERVRASGRPATTLLLAKAGYLGCIANDCPERLAALRAAERGATGDDLMRARHALVRYLTETSRYRRATALCDSALAEAAGRGDAGLRWRATYLTARGVARYATLNDPAAARRDLGAALALVDGSDDADLVECRSEALHYLGRCLLDEGDVAGSLEHYLAAARVREQLPFQSGAVAYHHVRMAETLMGAGALDDADDHLGAARDLLDRIGDSGSTTVVYLYALANAHALRGEAEAAVKLLDECAAAARRCRFARGRLLALARVLALHLRRRDPLRAAATLVRIAPLLVTGELRRTNAIAISVRLRRYAAHVRRPYGAPRPGAGTPVLQCPCPVHRGPGGRLTAR
jgi:tetratricopeptide (TPR) repeat protein